MKTEQRKQISFKGQSFFVGLDVHLKSWTVTILSETSVLRKFSMSPDPETLVALLKRDYPDAVYYSVYEAGFCGFWIHERLTELGVHNIVINPADVPTTSGERMRKTDAVDSRKLAMGLRAGQLKGIYVPDSTSQEIRSLTRLKNIITKDTTRQKNRIKALLRYLGVKIPQEYLTPYSNWSKRFIAWLKDAPMRTASGRETLDLYIRQLEDLRRDKLEVTRSIRCLSKTERFREPLELIMSVPGIGQATGMAILAEVCDFNRFTSAEKFAAYVGMIPMCHSSGEHDGTGNITRRSNATLRANLIEAAWVAVRQDPAMTLMFTKYCKSMPASKAIVKIARKLCNRIFCVIKNKMKYVNGVIS